MKFGVELLTNEETEIRIGSYVEMLISVNDTHLHRARGQDEYHLSTTMPAGNRIAASGRSHICQVDLPAMGLGPMEAKPAVTVPLPVSKEGKLTIFIRTNLTLDKETFQSNFQTRILFNGDSIPINQREFTSPRPGLYLLKLQLPVV